MNVRSSSVLAALALALSLPATAQGGPSGHSKLDRVLRAAEQTAHPPTERVIIQTRSAAARQALERALRAHGDTIEDQHPSLNALTVQLHGEDLAALDADPSVLVVSSDADVTVTSAKNARPDKGNAHANGHARKTSSSSSFAPLPGLLRDELGANTLAYQGRGIGVAIIDSGIEPNADLLLQIRGFWDFTRGGVPAIPYDDYGHGTHVAGLIASNGGESGGAFTGVAPGARLFGFKVLDKNGRGHSSDVLKALEFIVANHDRLGIDVINLSLGHPVLEPAATDPLVQAVESAVRAGIVVVTAAGNVGADDSGKVGYAGITSPGNAPSAITVGAVDTHDTVAHSDDRVAFFSSRGPTWYDGFAKPDVVAPGVGLVSNAARYATLYREYPEILESVPGTRSQFAVLSGTSMAAAVTTGVVADVLEASRTANRNKPELTPNAVKALLQYTALPVHDDHGAPYDALTQGTGEVNVVGAAGVAAAIDTSIPVGQPWTAYRLSETTTLGGETMAWAQNIVWGTSLVTGSNIVWSNSLAFGDNIVWGTSALCSATDPSCDNIVWGTAAFLDNIVWGTNIVWSSNIVWGTSMLGVRDGDNIVWGTALGRDGGDNIVWGTAAGRDGGDNIVWGTSLLGPDNIVWGTLDRADNIVWGTLTGALGGF
ncbi:MAG TPA: S8 family serine peptidase [Vicinamibacterales bacterium]|nr:S8 family serine peptidase [Vicinamibacterales bacterium]